MNQFEMRQKAYQSSLNSRALQVLLYLIDRADREQTCFPAVPTIGRELHISISTVKRAMKELVASGYVRKESRFREGNRGQTSNLYTLFFPERQEREAEKEQELKEGVECMADQEETADRKGAADRGKSNVENSGEESLDAESTEVESANVERDGIENSRLDFLGARAVIIEQEKSGESKDELVNGWLRFKKRMFWGVIVCWGDGLRSSFGGEWLWNKCAYFKDSFNLDIISDLRHMWTGEGVRMRPP